MPRIVDPQRYKKDSIDKEIEKVEKEIEKEKEEKALAEGGKKKKKEPNWPLLYVLFAIAFFGLGILVICLMNLAIHGTFGL